MKPSIPVLAAALLAAVAACDGEPSVPPPASGYVEVEGGRIWYETMGGGDATPVLVIHGGPGSQSCGYLETLGQLATQRPVIVYDQLGSGKSDRPTDTTLWRVPRFVDEVGRLREALGLEEVHILGHSWGGAVAIEYMLTGPEGVRSLVLTGPLVGTARWIADADTLRMSLPEDVQAALTAGEESGDYDSPEYQAATDAFYARFLRRSGWPRPPRALCEGRSGNSEVYNYMWGPTEFTSTGTLRDFDRTGDLHRLDLPVMFIAGRYDEARPETMFDFHRLVPGSVVQIIENAGHAVMDDRSAEYNSAVSYFLGSIEGPSTDPDQLLDDIVAVLRDFGIANEIHYADHRVFSDDPPDASATRMWVRDSVELTVRVTEDAQGWSALATHVRSGPGAGCVMKWGNASAIETPGGIPHDGGTLIVCDRLFDDAQVRYGVAPPTAEGVPGR